MFSETTNGSIPFKKDTTDVNIDSQNCFTKQNDPIDWDGVLSGTNTGYTPRKFGLDGEYDFTVTNLEKTYYAGSAKLPACNQAVITMAVETEQGTVSTKTDLKLVQMFSAHIMNFFLSIGMERDDEGRLQMDWNDVVGRKGRALFKPKTFTGRDGKEHISNDIKFLTSNSKSENKSDTLTFGQTPNRNY